jgi:hypothetical protein
MIGKKRPAAFMHSGVGTVGGDMNSITLVQSRIDCLPQLTSNFRLRR